MTLHDASDLGKTTVVKWNQHQAPRLSAALAYYTLLSLAPVIVLIIAIYGLAFTRNTAEQKLLDQVQTVAGYAAVNTIKGLMENVHQTKTGIFASIVAAVVLFLSASGVFSELRDSLNTIWDAPEVDSGVREMILHRFVSFALVLALGLLLLISLLVGIVLNTLQVVVTDLMPANTALLGQALNLFLSFLATAVLFAFIFKFVPDVPIAWRDVGIGSLATAGLFTIGRVMLGIYLTKAAVGSAYGAAGSVVALLVWVYYSAQIFLFGAIFTRVYAVRFGSRSTQPIRNQSAKTQGAN